MNRFYSSVIILVFFVFVLSACKKEREPWKRIEIKEGGYEFECLGCEKHSTNGYLYDYNSLKIHFKHYDPKVNIGEDAYIKVIWNFDTGVTGQFLIDYQHMTLIDDVVSFNSSWNYSNANNLHVDIILYSGMGSKSNTLGLDIAKPIGAAKLVK